MAISKTPLERRIMNKFTAGDDCWEWKAGRNQSGYGVIGAGGNGGRPLRAHRVLYEILVGPIPAGLDIDHLCRNRGCVNPAHLEPVTRSENVRRGIAPLVTRQRAAERTHCKRGHEFTPENTYMQKLRTGSLARSCRKCAALRESRRHERRRAG